MARITGSHLVCKALQLEGVKNIFGLAGDHILPLLEPSDFLSPQLTPILHTTPLKPGDSGGPRSSR